MTEPWHASGLNSMMKKVNWLKPAASKANIAEEQEKEKVIEEFHELLKLLENELKGIDFLVGESFGYLGIAVLIWYPSVQEVVGLQYFSEEKFPMICKWIRKLHEIEVAKKCLPSRLKHLPFTRSLYEALKRAQR
ncbi:hypothetical protein FNV43_RR05075 [Rhamnella rubrinervis]|uniref:GST C-terminal domain-containing protein n=1 Tax=Rhamnella rubrinervis TaxID=2594499 RepID=A0A8K0MQC4_9ROSA|nr:hypothetical protein FNV43_RR05075 [Rhamnella rubrinervis]